MTKQELLDLLGQKFTGVILKNLKKGETEGNLTHWAIPVFDKVGDILRRQWIHFYTDELNNAYWQDNEPKPTPPIVEPTFQDDLQSFINSKVADGTIEGANIEIVDNVNETAIVQAWLIDNGLKEKRLFVDKDTLGEFKYQVIS